jgi:hypothetical protein
MSLAHDSVDSRTLAGSGADRSGVKSGAVGVASRSRLLMSWARSLVAASRIERTPTHEIEVSGRKTRNEKYKPSSSS